MDPSYPYSHRSLSSATATDAAQYEQYEGYPQSAGYAAQYPSQGYEGSHQYQGTSQRSGYAAYQHDDQHRQLPSTYSMSSSASYPGAAVHPSSVRHMPPTADGRTVSAPGGHSYSTHGQVHLPPPHASSSASAAPLPPYALTQPQHAPRSSYSRGYLPTSPQAYQPRTSASTSPVAHQAQYPPPPASVSPGLERFPCDKCEKTFSRAHDRKRHYESQHSAHPYVHRCRWCKREFSRADSLKRHLDNGCDKDPSYADEA